MSIYKRLHFFISLLLAFAYSTNYYSQSATFNTIPSAVNGSINICAGSTVLFNSTVAPNSLNAPAVYAWNFGNGQNAAIPGPIGITYATPGTYTVTYNISSAGTPLTQTSITVNVAAAPAVVPTIGPGNNCTQMTVVNGIPVYQATGNNCQCAQNGPGPIVSLSNANTLPAGSSATINWGAIGTGSITTTFPVGSANPLTIATSFPGQQNGAAPASHYNSPGAYNMVYMVTLPGGCVYSYYCIMSYGGGAISLGTLTAQTQCNPLLYNLTFANQTPGNTYVINWGDGTANTTFVYPNLPLLPNGIPHSYAPSPCTNGVPQSYTITVSATNTCASSLTNSTIGPFNVSSLPNASFTSAPSNTICQNQSITFTNTSNGGLSIANNTCSTIYNFGWNINFSSFTSGAGYAVTAGSMGDPFNNTPVNGSNQLSVQFTQAGTYFLSLDATNAACGGDNETQTITVNPIPVVPNQTATICSGSSFSIAPINNPPNTIVPAGTTYTWTVAANPNVTGEVGGTNDTIMGTLINITNVSQTVVYTVTPTVNGCSGAPFTVTVTVIPAIVIPNFTQTICNGTSFSINPVNAPPTTIIPSGTTFTWTVVDNPNVTGESNGSGMPLSQTLTSNLASPTQSVVYTITAVSPGGTCPPVNFTATITINVITIPVISGDATICSGGDPAAFNLITAATGSGNVTYQWQSSTTSINSGYTNIAGATSPTYDPPAGLTLTTYYQVVVTSVLNGVSCTANSNPISVIVNNVSAGTLSQTQTICSGGDANPFTVVTAATGTGTLSYQWQSSTTSAVAGFTNILGATNATYDPPGGQTITTFYRLIVTSTLNGIVCTSTSAVLTVFVNNISPSVITNSQTICSSGNPAAFTNTTAATGTGTLSYQWQSSTTSPVAGFTNIAGATLSTYDAPAGLTVTTYYQVIITSTLNGVPCTATSNVLTVTINSVSAASIASSQTICSGGDPVAFTVTTASTGTGTLSYQWQSSTTSTIAGYSNIIGATNSTYDPPAGITVSTYYQVITSSTLNGIACTAISNPLSILVNNVSAGVLASNQTICSGGNPNAFTITTAATGTGTLSYQWQSSTTSPAAGFTPIINATNSTYDPPAGQTLTTYYQLIVTSTLNGIPCTATSAVLTVSINNITPSTIGSNETICSGGNPVAFTNTTAATGSGNITYQWQSSTTSTVAGYINIANATLSTYDPPAGLTLTTYYQVIITSTLNGVPCSVISNPITVTVNNVSAGTLSQTQTICSGGDANPFTVTTAATGTGTLSYQWQSSTISAVAGFNDIVGATNATYDPPGGQTVTTFFRLIVTSTLNGIVCTSTSTVLTVFVNNISPSVITNSQTICSGGNPAAFTNTTAATGTGTLSYQWQSSTTSPVAGFTNIANAVQSTYDAPAGLTVTTYYQVIITSTLNGVPCTAISNPLTVFVNTINAQTIAANQTICSNGDPVPFTVTVASIGAGITTYQWQVSTTAINSGYTSINQATNSTYDVPAGLNVTSYYQVISTSVLNNITCTATSNPLTVTVTAAPFVQNFVSTICSGSSVNVNPVNGGGNIVPPGTTYTWTVSNNPNLTGQINQPNAQNNFVQTITNISSQAQTIIYTVTPLGGVCLGTPFTVTVTVNPNAVITAQSATICSGTLFTINPVNSPPQTIIPPGTVYSWVLPTSSPAGAVTGGSIATNQLNVSQTLTNTTANPATLTYTVTPLSGNCQGTNFQVVVTVNPAPVIAAVNQSICSGSAFNFTPNVIGNIIPSNTLYTWTYVDNPSITGETSNNIGAASINQILTNTTNTNQSVVYSITPTSGAQGNCVGNNFNLTLTVNPLPTLPATNLSICSGQALTFTPQNGNGAIVPAGTTLSWALPTISGSITGASIGTNQNIFTQTLTNTSTAIQTATYSVTPIGPAPSSCQGTPFNIVVTLNIAPLFPNQSASLCSGNSYTSAWVNNPPTMVIPNGTTYSWSNPIQNPVGSVTGISPGVNQNNFFQTNLQNTTSQTSTLTYTVTPSAGGGGCAGLPFQVVLTINPTPVIPAQTLTSCSGANFISSPTNNPPNSIIPNGTTYTWNTPIVTGNLSGGANGTNQNTITGNLVNPTAIQQTATYTITPSTANGQCTGQPFTLLVNVSPSPFIPNQTATICSGANFNSNLTAAIPTSILPNGTTFTWATPVSNPIGAITGGIAGNAQNNISQVLTNTSNAVGTLTYTLSPSSNVGQVCIGNPFSYTVTINPTPTITNQTATICSGNTFTISPTNGAGNTVPSGTTYQWSFAPNANITGASNVNTASNSISQTLINTSNVTQTILYTVTPTSGAQGACIGNPFTATITVNPLPIITNQTLSICSGNNFQLNLANNPPTLLLPGNTTYTWPSPIIVPAATVTGSSAQNNTNAITQTLINTTANSSTVTYQITPNSNACVGNPFTLIVTVNPTPLIPAQTQTLCSGNSFSFTPTNNPPNTLIPSGILYSWGLPVSNPLGSLTGGTTGSLENAISEGTITNTTNTSATLVYSITGNSPQLGACPSNAFTLTVTVNPSPVISTQNTTICSGLAFAVSPTNNPPNTIIPNGINYSWTSPSVPISITGGSAANGQLNINGQLTNTSNTNQIASYTVIPSSGPNNSCVGQPFTVNVTVQPTPSIPNQTQTICSGNPFTINLVNGQNNIILPAGTTYSWGAPIISPNGSLTGSSAQNNQNNISQTLTNTTSSPSTASYIITPLGGNLCSGTSFTSTITVNPSPTIPAAALNTCSGVAFNYSPQNGVPNANTIVPIGTTYTWTAPVVTGGLSGGSAQNVPQNSISQTLTNPTNVSQTATYTITPTSGNCIGVPFTLTVTLNPIPTITAQNTTSCSGVAFTVVPSNVTNVIPAGTTYSWPTPIVTGNLTGGTAANNQGTISQILNNPTNLLQTAQYTVTPNAGLNCFGSPFIVTVTINPVPIISAQTQTICSGGTFTINPTNNQPSTIVPSNTTYSWALPISNPLNSINGGASGNNSNNISGTLTNTLNSTATQTYIVTPTSGAAGACIGANFNLVVSVNATPQISNQLGSICSGLAYALNPTNGAGFGVVPANTTYSWPSPTVSGNLTGQIGQNGQNNINAVLTNTSNISQTATYTITPTSGAAGNCLGNTFNLVLTVNPTPLIPNVNQTICSNSAFTINPINTPPNTLVPTPTTYTWPAAVVTGNITGGIAGNNQASISQVLNNPTNTPQTATYTITATAGVSGACTSTFSSVITVNPSPVIQNVTQTICSGASFLITPSNGIPTANNIVPGGTIYTWGAPIVTGGITGGAAGNGSINIGGTLTNPTNISQTATYTITPTSGAAGNCIGQPFTLTVTINPTPVIPAQSLTICSGGNVNFTPINSLPQTIVPNGTVYSWGLPTSIPANAISGATALVNQNAIVQTLTSSAVNTSTATYTITPSTNGCVGLPFPFVVTLYPAPNIPNATLNACSSSPINYSPANVPAGTNFIWSLPIITGGISGASAQNVGVNTFNQTLVNPTNVVQTATYTIVPQSGAAGACPGTPFTLTITLNPTPVIGNTVLTSCSNVAFNLSPTNNPPTTIVPSGTSYTWPSPTMNGGISGGNSGNSQASISGTLTNPTTSPQTSIYSIVPSVTATGCTGAPFNLTVTINPIPVISNVSIPTCSGVAFNVTPPNNPPSQIVPSGTLYSWTQPIVTGGITGGSAQNNQATISQTLTNPTNLPQTATYTVTPTSGAAGSCAGASFTVIITVNPTPLLPTQTVSACSGIAFSSNPQNNLPTTIIPGGTTYTWGNPVVTGNVSGGSAQINQANISQTLANPTNIQQTATYIVTPTSGAAGSCQGANFTLVVTINPIPSIPAQSSSVCSGLNFLVNPINGNPNTIVPNGTTYSWTAPVVTGLISGGSAQNNQATISQTLTNPTNTPQTAIYTVTPTSGAAGACPGSSFSVTVIVNPTPVIPNQTQTICSNSAFLIALQNNPPSTLLPNGTTYSWTNPIVTGGITGGSAQNNQAAISQTLINPTSILQTATYTVTATSGVAGNCVSATFQVVISVNPSPIIANGAITSCSNTLFNYAPNNNPPNSIVPNGTTYSWQVPQMNGGITGGVSNNAQNNINGTLVNPTSTSQTAVYSITPSYQGCTGAPFSVTVTLNPIPVISNVSIPTCSGVAFNVSPSNNPPSQIVPSGTLYSWTQPIVTGNITGGSAQNNQATISQTLTNPTNVPQTATYSVTPTSGAAGACPGTPFTVIVTVNPTPLLPTQTVSACSGIAFTSNPQNNLPTTIIPSGTTYTWGNPVVTGNVSGGSAQINQANISQTLTNPTNIQQTATYIVTPTSGAAGSCQGANFTLVVTINPVPSIPSQNISVCSGTNFLVNPINGNPNTIVPNGTTYSWTAPVVTGLISGGSAQNNQATISQTLTNPTNTPQTAIYTVTPTSGAVGACPGSSFSVTVIVNPTPVIPNQTQTICSNSAFLIALQNNPPSTLLPNGTTYSWTNPIVTGGITGGSAQNNQAAISQTLINPTSLLQTATYTVTATSGVAGNCVSTTFQVVISVNPSPIIGNGTLTACSNTLFNYAPTNNPPNSIVPNGTTYSWTNPIVTGGVTGGSAQNNQALIGEILQNPTAAIQTATYTITPNFGVCSGAPFQLIVSINPTPVVPNQNLSICSQTAFNLALINNPPSTIIPANTIYNWPNPVANPLGSILNGSAGVNQQTITQNLNNITSNVATLTYTITPSIQGTGCISAPFTLVVTVNPTPVVSNQISNVCSGSAFSYTPANIPPGTIVPNNTVYSWNTPVVTGNVGGGASASNQLSISQTLINPTNTSQTATYTVVPTSGLAGNCQGLPFNFLVNINPTPVGLPQQVNICSGNAFVVSPTNNAPSEIIPLNTVYSWTVPTVTASITGGSAMANQVNISQVLTNTSNTIETATYTVTPTSGAAGACVGSPFQVTVTVSPEPVITSPTTLTICNNQAVNLNLTASIASTFNWTATLANTPNVLGASLSANTSASINDVLNNTTNANQTVVYTVTPSSVPTACLGQPVNIIVTVNPDIIITSNPTIEICTGGQVNLQLTSNVPSTFTWFDSPPYNANVTGSTTISTQGNIINDLLNNISVPPSPQVVNYTIFPTSTNGGCTGQAQTVSVLVGIPLNYTGPDSVQICSGETLAIPLSASQPSSFTWYANLPNFPIVTGTSLTLQSGATIDDILVLANGTSTPQEVTYLVYPTTLANGCASNGFPVVVTINPNPIVISNDTIEICSGDTFAYSLNSNQTVVYSWSAAINNNIQGEITTPQQTSSINGTLINFTNVDQLVNYTYQATTNSGCTSPIGQLVVIVHPLPSVSFIASSYAICENVPIQFTNTTTPLCTVNWEFGDGNSSTLANPLYAYNGNSGTFNVQLTATTQFGCVDSAFNSVLVNPMPAVGFTVNSPIGCVVFDATFTDTINTPNTTLLWTFGDGQTSNQSGFVDHQYNVEDCYDVTLTVTDNIGCSSTQVVQNMVCVYDIPTAIFTTDELVHLTTESQFEFTNLSTNANTYLWNFDDGFTSLATNPIHTFPENAANYTVVLYAFNEAGCYDSTYLNLLLLEDLLVYVPNSFTPNMDGANDEFLPVIQSGYKRDSYTLSIYNRWGELVFVSHDPLYGWTGQYGYLKCPVGTYTWVINFQLLQTKEDKEISGHINLLK